MFTADERHLINTVIAIPAWRNDVTGRTVFTFYETSPGYARALHKWFHPGNNMGQEFRYPKQLALLTASAATTSAQSTQREQNSETQTEAPAPTAAPAGQSESQETAQATPPAAPPPQPEAAPAPAPETPPAKLPKTATPYPAIGLAGLVCLFLYGCLRLRRFA